MIVEDTQVSSQCQALRVGLLEICLVLCKFILKLLPRVLLSVKLDSFSHQSPMRGHAFLRKGPVDWASAVGGPQGVNRGSTVTSDYDKNVFQLVLLSREKTIVLRQSLSGSDPQAAPRTPR